MHTKINTNGGSCSPPLASSGFTGVVYIRYEPTLAHNISDLPSKPVRKVCRQIVRRDMENFEGCDLQEFGN
jgi:hypothetical protein